MAPGFPVAGGSQVLGSVNSGVAPWQARLVPNVFRWSTDFSRRSPFRVVRGRQVLMSTHGARALRSKLFDIVDLRLPPCLTHCLRGLPFIPLSYLGAAYSNLGKLPGSLNPESR